MLSFLLKRSKFNNPVAIAVSGYWLNSLASSSLVIVLPPLWGRKLILNNIIRVKEARINRHFFAGEIFSLQFFYSYHEIVER